jgi:hypothetical protein
MQAIRVGKHTEEEWNIKIKYTGNANNDPGIVEWAYNNVLAGFMLQEEVDDHIAKSNSRANNEVEEPQD